jgi:hypothetical protein
MSAGRPSMKLLAVSVAFMALLGQPAVHAGVVSSQEGTFALAAPCAIACSYWVDNGFAPCTNDFPPGTYSEVLTPPAPAVDGILVAAFEITPEVDWDSFACTYPEREEIGRGANLLGGQCDLIIQPLFPLGCREWVGWVATPGAQYTLLAYNWSDYAELPYRLFWIVP